MATDNLSVASNVGSQISNAIGNADISKVRDYANQTSNLVPTGTDYSAYIKNAVENFGSYTAEQKAALRADPIGFLKSTYDAVKGVASTPTTEKNYTARDGQDNFYAGQNTIDHSDELSGKYDETVAQHNTAIDTAVENAVSDANAYQDISMAGYGDLRDVAAKDYAEAIATRDAIEANNGNRGGLGHAQYGSIESAYNARLGELSEAEENLRTQTVRAVADARSAGDYAKADAILSSAQSKFQAIYEEQMRIDENMRSNYEWQTEIDQEDKDIQAEYEENEKAWNRSMGEALLKAGIIPGDQMLADMGISKTYAMTIAAYARANAAGGSGGGSGGSSGGGGSGGSGSSGSQYSSGTLSTGLPDDAYGRFVSIQRDQSTANQGVMKAYGTGTWNDAQTYNALKWVDSGDYSNTSKDTTKNVDYWDKYNTYRTS